jgi:hypothetical protein
MSRMIVATLVALLLIAILSDVARVEEPLRVRCQWQAPTSGSPAVLYHLQITDLDGGLDTTYVVPAQPGEVQEFYFLDGAYLRRYVARVRGIDADGDEGPWSAWSSIYAFEVEDP